MMRHPAWHELQALAGGQNHGRNRARNSKHIRHCTRCGQDIAWITATREALHVTPDLNTPGQTWSRIRSRVQRGETVLLPLSTEVHAAAGAWRRTAAIVALLVLSGIGGVAALARVDSVRALVQRITALGRPAPTEPNAATPEAPAVLTLYVAPEAGVLEIVISEARQDLRLRVQLVDAPELQVKASGAAASARYRSGAGRLTIEEPGSGEIALLLPRAVNRITVDVDGRPVLVMDQGNLKLLVKADTLGAEFILTVR